MSDKKRILIVDDEFNMVEMVKLRLEAYGYEVLTAHDGQEGLQKAQQEKPDLIILDLMLPKMDGYKVCGLLKADTRFNRIPIIMFSAKAQMDDVQQGEELGADGHIAKPFEPEVLMAKIRDLLQ